MTASKPTSEPSTPPSPSSAKPSAPSPTLRRTRFVLISDTHKCTPALPPGDVLIHAGDLTNQGSFSEVSEVPFLVFFFFISPILCPFLFILLHLSSPCPSCLAMNNRSSALPCCPVARKGRFRGQDCRRRYSLGEPGPDKVLQHEMIPSLMPFGGQTHQATMT